MYYGYLHEGGWHGWRLICRAQTVRECRSILWSHLNKGQKWIVLPEGRLP